MSTFIPRLARIRITVSKAEASLDSKLPILDTRAVFTLPGAREL